MKRRPSPTHHRAGGIGLPAGLAAAAGLLVLVVVLVVVLPLEQATAVVGMVCSVATGVIPAWLNHGRPSTRRVLRRSGLR